MARRTGRYVALTSKPAVPKPLSKKTEKTMSKKYVEAWPSELGTILRSNWTWFPASLNGDRWYANGHVAMPTPPVKDWPTEPPRGMTHRVRNFQAPPEIQIPKAQLDRMNKPLVETERTRRKGRAVSADEYLPGIVRFKDADGAVHSVSRHYHALIMRRFPLASPFGNAKFKQGPIVYREADGTLVAVLMPLLVSKRLKQTSERRKL
jgi:hypothetical protein